MPIPLLSESPEAVQALKAADVLYTDLDGTLLGRGGSVLADWDGRPTTETAEAVVALNRAGLKVVPVSGRGRVQLVELVRALGWRDYIAEVGSIIVHDRGEDVVFDVGEWPESVLQTGDSPYDLIDKSGALETLQAALPGRIERHDPYDEGREATRVLRGNVDVLRARELLGHTDPPVSIVDNGVIHPWRHTLSGVDVVHAYHLLPAGVSKHRAISLDLAMRGLSSANAVAVGDSVSDIQMAEAVGLFVLVGNALDDPAVEETASSLTNVVRVEGRMGAGWAEMARVWLTSKGL